MTILYYVIGFALLLTVIIIYAMMTSPLMDENGNLLDKEGNIVDDRGRIIKSVEEIKKEFAKELDEALKRNK